MTVDEIKTTVRDFSQGNCTENQIKWLQRYFLKTYCCWMSLRAVAEVTGSPDHSRTLDGIKAVHGSRKLFNISLSIRRILDAQIKGNKIK